MLIAVGINWSGRRQILAVEMARGESRSAWKELLVALKGKARTTSISAGQLIYNFPRPGSAK
ncbi:transposase [Mesorhizobium sp.]|uniref:transposase n=1 Tax=Mesorhizobium sp. TaxID=1871066 RepID=UPI00341AC0DE